MKDKILSALLTFQGCKILSLSIIKHCEVFSVLSLQIRHSNRAPWILVHVLLVPKATCLHQHSALQ